jgi:hypothetical protein
MASGSDDLEMKSTTGEQLETVPGAAEVIDTAGMREAHPTHPRVSNPTQHSVMSHYLTMILELVLDQET